MEGSVGKALSEARLQKKLSVEEVGRATKMRPDRILDLERDDYTRFPSLAYARSFLLLYAKFLKVDISKFHTMEIGNPAGVGDYQYLQNERGVDSLRFTRQSDERLKNPRWFRAFVVFFAMVVVGALCAYFYLSLLRLPFDEIKRQAGDRAALGTPEPSSRPRPAAQPSPRPPKAIPVTPGLEAAPALSPTPLLGGTATGTASASGTNSAPPRAIPLDAPSPTPAVSEPEPEVRRAEPVPPKPTPEETPDDTFSDTPTPTPAH